MFSGKFGAEIRFDIFPAAYHTISLLLRGLAWGIKSHWEFCVVLSRISICKYKNLHIFVWFKKTVQRIESHSTVRPNASLLTCRIGSDEQTKTCAVTDLGTTRSAGCSCQPVHPGVSSSRPLAEGLLLQQVFTAWCGCNLLCLHRRSRSPHVQ